jgi:mRNA interferase RelE/StbE
MKYKILFIEDAYEDLQKLDKSIQIEAIKVIKKLKENPYFGKPLKGNLKGFYKIYFFKKKYRMVYTIRENKLLILIVGIGKRDKEKIYKLIEKRREKLQS